MAEEEGTGRHAHKSSEEPYEHHEAPSTRGESDREPSGESRSASSGESSSGKRKGGRESGSSSESSEEESDLKSREYRDSEGNIHHHTRTSAAMQAGGSESEKRE